MRTQRTAFVVMPIKKAGSDEYQHFRALFDEVLKPTLEAAAFVVQRADDVQKSGAITKDIILRLADADLVVADLTDLNPNVFYELGVRHALRGVGTLMMLDELRTTDIPFDLSAYRVIKFKAELNGIGRLRNELAAYAKSFDGGDMKTRDNPVHDWLPVLPVNSLETASGTNEGKLREQLAQARNMIRQYEKMAGSLPNTGPQTKRTPLETVLEARRDAEEGNLAFDLVEAARMAVDQRDAKAFLIIVQRIMERPDVGLQSDDYRVLASMAHRLGLQQYVPSAILAHGLSCHPKDQELRRSQLSMLAHSSDADDRQQARNELAQIVGVKITGEAVSIPERVTDDLLQLYAIMLDTYHAEEMHEEALRIAKIFGQKFPEYSIVCRNTARALKNCGQADEALKWYKRGITTPDVSDSSAVWYGNSLHNDERHVDAMEAYLVACRLDPSDGANFAHVADELSFAWVEQVTNNAKGRSLPDSVNAIDKFCQFVLAAFSCDSVDAECLARCRSAARRAEINIRDLEELIVGRSAFPDGHDEPLSDIIENEPKKDIKRIALVERVKIVKSLYEVVRSKITDPDDQG